MVWVIFFFLGAFLFDFVPRLRRSEKPVLWLYLLLFAVGLAVSVFGQLNTEFALMQFLF